MINMDIRVGSHTLKEEKFGIRLEIPHSDFITIIQIAAPATANVQNKQKQRVGVVVDIDTICNYKSDDLTKFKHELLKRLDAIHF